LENSRFPALVQRACKCEGVFGKRNENLLQKHLMTDTFVKK